jgi:hypothetical protein
MYPLKKSYVTSSGRCQRANNVVNVILMRIRPQMRTLPHLSVERTDRAGPPHSVVLIHRPVFVLR